MTGKFFIDGEEHAEEPFVYRVSGLDGVLLLNGFAREETDYGPGVSIKNIDGLHRAIALHIIATRKALSPREFRFLRREMDLTQNQLAALLGVDGQTVARYEKGESRISGPVDRLIRFWFAFRLLPEEDRHDLIARIEAAIERDEVRREPVRFAESGGLWHEVAG